MLSVRNHLNERKRSIGRPLGFTLIELMVTIAVFAILLGIAAPSFNDALLGSKLSSYANNMVASANLARGEAIKRNAEITLCVSANGTSCSDSGGWEQGWIVACRSNDSVTCNATGTSTLVFYRQQAASSGLKITETTSTLRAIAFPSTGVGGISSTLKICRFAPSAGSRERIVTITTTARASVRKTATGTCS